MQPVTRPSPEALLAESDWVRRLARRLVHDRTLADDLAQETWARALEGGPRGGWPLRSWLGGVLRNLARAERRERARREARERAAARPEALPSAAEALERIETQRDVVEAVLALEEPYRSTIVLRFHENLPPRRIAARTGVPVATVKTRLARGLAQLRSKLDSRHGSDGSSWALALLPLAARPRLLGPSLAGVLAMNMLAKSAALAAVAIGIVVWVEWRGRGSGSPALEAAGARDRPALVVPDPPAAERIETPGARESVAAARAPQEPPAREEPETLAGRVIDVSGVGVAGVELGIRGASGSRLDGLDNEDFGSALWDPEPEHAQPLAVSGSDGRFAFQRPPDSWGRIVSRDEHWETVLAPMAHARLEGDQVVVVAPRFQLEGTVRDEAGNPLAEVEVRFGVPRERLHGSGADLGGTLAGDWTATSDAQGRFFLARLPAVAGARLRARLEPFETALIERELWSDGEIEIVLERPQGAWLEGIVAARGAPVERAVVALGTRSTRTDASGGFRIHLAGLEKEQELCAAGAGFLPARLLGDRNGDGTVRWPPFVQLSLAGEPLELAGIVVDAGGRPMAGQEVWITRGRTTLHDEFPVLLESVLAGKPDTRLGGVTGEDGRFRISGLEPHDYHLRVVDPGTALVNDAGPFPAGKTGLEIRQPTDELWPVVHGRVVSRAGAPIAKVPVSVEREIDVVGVPGKPFFAFDTRGAQTSTDEDGVFELHDVPKKGVRLSILSLEVVDPELELCPELDPLDVQVVVDRWVALEVRVGSTYPAANAFSALDAAGEAVLLKVPTSGGISLIHRQELSDGSSPVVSTGDQATTLVLYRDSEELARVPLVLRPGIVNTVDL